MFVILGGQHFLRALCEYRIEELSKPGMTEAMLPRSLRECEMVVLSQPCPFGLRAWKAGRHQREQTGVPSNVADYFEVVVKAAKDKIKAAGEAVFTDNEVWGLVQRSGLKPEQKEKDIRSASSDLTPKEIEKRMEDLVCTTHPDVRIAFLLPCRDTTPSTPGLPSPVLLATWWRLYRRPT